MSNRLWKAKWERNDIAFHQDIVNPLLQRFLSRLTLSAGDHIIVPLCGKSLDMNWIGRMGFRVIGIELSDIAIQAYFEALHVVPNRERHGRFVRWWHEGAEVWCGDIFDLTSKDLGEVKALYDCAALTALPAGVRERYITHFAETLPKKTEILLITIETPDERHFNSVSTIDSEVKSLYGARYRIDLLHGQNSITRDPENPGEPEMPMEEKVYLMTRH